MCVKQLEEGREDLENQYTRSVRKEGNEVAKKMIREVFHTISRKWRGIGEIPQSGFALNSAYGTFNAERRFSLGGHSTAENVECIGGLILNGNIARHGGQRRA